MEATNGSLLLNIALVLAISTAQRIFAIKIRWTKIHAAISQDYLLGAAHFVRKRKNLRRCGRDALNNTSCECVVAKANESDCLANAEVQTREEGGKF